MPLEQAYAQPWGLTRMYDPAYSADEQDVRFRPVSSYPRVVFRLDDVDEVAAPDEQPAPNGTPIEISTDKAVIIFDLEMPVKAQTQRAGRLLSKYVAHLKELGLDPRKSHSNKKQKWRRHLQVLDAIEEGVKPEDIAKRLKYYSEYRDRSAASQQGNRI